MVDGYHVHKAAYRECLSDGDNRLVFKEGLELERVQYDGCAAVREPSERNNRSIRLPCNLQYGSGKSVYGGLFYQCAGREQHRNQHGRKRQSIGQYPYRASVAEPQVRGYLPETLRDDEGVEGGSSSLLQVLQHGALSSGAGLQRS